MNWWKRKEDEPVQDDVGQAREMRAAAHEEFAALRAQAPVIRRKTQWLINRGIDNHFGDSIQITYVRK